MQEKQGDTNRAAVPHQAVLVIETEPLASSILQRQNAMVEVHHPREVTTKSCSHIARTISDSEYKMLWLELPTNGRGFLVKKRGVSLTG